MCGVAGVCRFDGSEVVPRLITRMTDALVHRGPDDSGMWIEGAVGLGHRRLSIIDVAGSHQPMQSADGRWVICFNGEIFNYRELRASLRYPFRTQGDTEVILAGIATHGIDFITELVGQFAICLFDRADNRLHLVRDRLGILPLFYARSGASFLFASEVKAILAASATPPSVDERSLDSYLSARSVPAPHTLFEGILKLPAAHRAEVDGNGTVSVHRYWQLPAADPKGEWSVSRAVDAVDEAVTEAVKSTLVADVPVGAYLSGGVDSSLIVAKISAVTSSPVKTFAAGFGDPRVDELQWARRVSAHCRTDHHEVVIDASDFESLWPRLTWHRDAPVSQPADIAIFRLAEAARREVKVILSGEGGDELFAGYPKYRVAAMVAALSRAPAGMRQRFAATLDTHLPRQLGRARIALRAFGEPTAGDRHRMWFAPFTRRERDTLLGDLPRRPSALPTARDGDEVRAMLVGDMESWLPDNLLERGDRMSMAASLELRPPLLDHRLVELAFRLPSDVKVRSGTTKWVLKEVARRSLPAAVVDREKAGFRVPLDTWFRDSLRDSIWDRLTGADSFVAQVFDRAAVRELLTRHDGGRFDEESRIFTLMSLEVWHETFFGRSRHAQLSEG